MNKCKKAVSVLLIATMLVFMLSGCGGKTVTTENTGSSEYRVCMITDAGDITDQSFNQTTYEACRDYCKDMTLILLTKNRMVIQTMPEQPWLT